MDETEKKCEKCEHKTDSWSDVGDLINQKKNHEIK